MSDLNSCRILYLEDDEGLARLLEKNLSRLGYQVDLAHDGLIGLGMLRQKRYDLVLTDYHMPRCGGLEVIRLMAQTGDTTPVIMVTGNGNERIAVEALKQGAADYLVKDTQMNYMELLPIVIEQVLEKSRLMRDKERVFSRIQETEARYRNLVEHSPDGIAICNNGTFCFINQAGARLLGASVPEELMGKAVADFIDAEDQEIFAAQMEQIESGCCAPWVEENFIRVDRSPLPVEVSGIPFQYQGLTSVQLIFRDITERKQNEEQLMQLALFDTLTGLPNRALFYDRFSHTLERSRRYGHTSALLYLDLDRFKWVNDNLGHAAGDLLLKEIAVRLKATLRKSDTVARIGGDEFAVILPQISRYYHVETVAGKIIESVMEPVVIHGKECHVGVSIGISTFPAMGETAEALIKKADVAMYQAKEHGRCHGFSTYVVSGNTAKEAQDAVATCAARCTGGPFPKEPQA